MEEPQKPKKSWISYWIIALCVFLLLQAFVFPNLFNEIKGDAFAPRNKHALAIDFVQEPPFFQVSETHAAKTWYLDPRAPKIERPHSIQNLREKMGKMGGANLNG